VKGKYDIHQPAGYLFPVDIIREAMQLQAPPPEALPSDPAPRIKTQYIPPPSPFISRSFPDGYLNEAKTFFNGNYSLDQWLQQPTTRLPMLFYLDRLLRKLTNARKTFLELAGIGSSDLERGEASGKMHAIMPIFRIQAMLDKYKNNQYNGMSDYILDEKWLFSYLHLHNVSANESHPVLDMIEKSANPYELQSFILEHCWYGRNIDINKYLLTMRQRNAFGRTLNELSNSHQSLEFNTGYCMGMLKSLHMLPRCDAYWTSVQREEAFKKLCMFYATHARLDYNFVRKHFPESIQLLRKWRNLDIEKIKIIFIKTTIFRFSVNGESFGHLLQFFKKYQRITGTGIRIHQFRLANLYRKMYQHDQVWADRNLDGVVQLT
jgi:hypothetical protein